VQFGTDSSVDERKMENKLTQAQPLVTQSHEGSGEILLDLGNYAPARSSGAEEFVLDVDLNEVQEPSPAGLGASAWPEGGWETVPKPIEDPFATTRDLSRGVVPTPIEQASATQTTFAGTRGEEPPTPQSRTRAGGSEDYSVEHLSPEVIDAIARRAVEHLSEKVVQEIAWEVVPQLAELLIKRQLEEKNS
ncbi:MAG: hypothetical protein M3Y84_13235, partial [Acidobacteriota bacterium]|nr:hypothetical protein [Acidobacteriota bacterium]